MDKKYLPTLPTCLNSGDFSAFVRKVEINHLAIKSAFTNICERTDCFKELTEFKCGTITGCHKSVCEISSFVDIPQSTLSSTTGKWKQLKIHSNSTIKWKTM